MCDPYRRRARRAGSVEKRTDREVGRIEPLRRNARAPSDGPDAQDAFEVEKPEQAQLRGPGRDDPARGIEREGEDVHGALGRRQLRIAETDPRAARGQPCVSEGEEGAQLPGAGHEWIVATVRTRGIDTRP